MFNILNFADDTEVITIDKTFWEQKIEEVINWLGTNGLKLLLALIVLYISFKIVNIISKRIRKRMVKKNADKTATAIVYSVFRKGMKVLLFLVFLAYVGIDTASIGALLASLGVGIGLALQGSLSNLAGGIVIVIMRPFRIGDYIEAQGEGGTVEDIKMFYTYIVTPDNRTIMIPNGVLANGTIRNNSLKEKRRVDFEFNVSYDSDIKLVRDTLLHVCENDARIDKNPAPFVEIGNYGTSAIVFKTRVWTNNEYYWDLYFDILKNVKIAFDNNNIEIPYNKLDIQIKEKNNEEK